MENVSRLIGSEPLLEQERYRIPGEVEARYCKVQTLSFIFLSFTGFPSQFIFFIYSSQAVLFGLPPSLLAAAVLPCRHDYSRKTM